MVPVVGESEEARHAAAVLSDACFWPKSTILISLIFIDFRNRWPDLTTITARVLFVKFPPN